MCSARESSSSAACALPVPRALRLLRSLLLVLLYIAFAARARKSEAREKLRSISGTYASARVACTMPTHACKAVSDLRTCTMSIRSHATTARHTHSRRTSGQKSPSAGSAVAAAGPRIFAGRGRLRARLPRARREASLCHSTGGAPESRREVWKVSRSAGPARSETADLLHGGSDPKSSK